jgi:hypothetical protein
VELLVIKSFISQKYLMTHTQEANNIVMNEDVEKILILLKKDVNLNYREAKGNILQIEQGPYSQNFLSQFLKFS